MKEKNITASILSDLILFIVNEPISSEIIENFKIGKN